MEPASQAKHPQPPPASVETQRIERMAAALQKANQLMERHLAAGEKTVPARALYFILRDAGFGTSPQKPEVKQTPRQQRQVTNQLHHSYGLRR